MSVTQPETKKESLIASKQVYRLNRLMHVFAAELGITWINQTNTETNPRGENGFFRFADGRLSIEISLADLRYKEHVDKVLLAITKLAKEHGGA